MDTSGVQARMRELIERYYLLNRVTVGDDTSSFVSALAAEIGADVLSIPSSTECLTWIIPQKWTVREAYVETLAGKRVVDFAWHPLYLKSYSAPFSGTVSCEELVAHISTLEKHPDCLVYDYRWQYEYGEKRAWGFSMPYQAVQELNEKYYRVHIDTEFSPGSMDIVDWILPGKIPDTIFIAAHTCHPGQVNDGIANIAVAVELFRWLKQKPVRRYTYRAIFGPEYFAAAGLLACGKGVDKLRYGLFLDMLGNGKPLGFSRSYRGDSYVDLTARNVFKYSLLEHREWPYRGLWGNDEMFYDGPDFQIPTIGMGRDEFAYYHTDKDDVEHCDFAQLKESLKVLQNMVEVFETDCIPKRHYRGPLYLSRFGLYIDPKRDPKGYQSLQDIQILMNGTRSCLEIAEVLQIDYAFVRSFVDELCKRDLASLQEPVYSEVYET
jgi:aminopeptidase-like protein